jgi:nucleotide-binding universal stress UspA family protein
MKKILVPTDFSKTANKALDYAIKIAKCFGSEIHLLNSYELPHSGATLIINIDDLLAKDSHEALEKCVSKIEINHPDIVIKTHSKSGNASDTIIRYLKIHTIDLIIMGTTGASGIKGKIFGSTTSNLIKNISTPMFVVPSKTKLEDPVRIGISTDLKFKLNDPIYNPVKKLAAAFGSRVSFFNVNDIYKKEQLDTIEKQFGNEIDFVYGHDLEEGINEYLEDSNLNLLVLISEKHSLAHKIFKPSMTKIMAKKLTVPMLILPQK